MSFKPMFTKRDDLKEESKKAQIPEVKTEEPPVAALLEAAILENAKNDTPETRSKVYQELLFSDLLLALVDTQQAPQPQQSANDHPPQTINVAIMANPQGVQFAATFTSAAAARKWRADGGQYVAVRGQDIFKMLEPSPAEVIVVNPGSSPFVILNKADFTLLGQGTVPQSPQSPVQSAPNDPNQPPEDSMQISFPPDAFNDEQKSYLESFFRKKDKIEAVALGALLPPNAPDESSWLRTIFLRTKQLPQSQEIVQKYCIELRDEILKGTNLFTNIQFEVGVMPDANFWQAVNQNNFTLFDNNPHQPDNNPKKAQTNVPPPRMGRKA